MADRMTPEQFAYWLQGFAELNHDAPTPEQWRSIREHLAAVFNKVTPPFVKPGHTDWGIGVRDLGLRPGFPHLPNSPLDPNAPVC